MSIKAKFKLTRSNLDLDIDVEIPSSGITVITGESGSGKTTLLRLLAGLEKADSGYIDINGNIWQQTNKIIPTYKRNIGYVFQEDNLFPHLTVKENLIYPKRPFTELTKELIGMMGIDRLLNNMPHELSGGERQRVALARALNTNPGLILMDEPLSSLDQKRKNLILPYLERIHKEIATPIIYVSHSKEEILRLADYIIEMRSGKVINQGQPNMLINSISAINGSPNDFMTILPAQIHDHDQEYNLTQVSTNEQILVIPMVDKKIGEDIKVKIPAKDVSIALSNHQDSSIINVLPGEITNLRKFNFNAHVTVSVSGMEIISLITTKSYHALNLKKGLSVFVQIKCLSLL